MADKTNKADTAARNGSVKLVGIIGATALLIGASFGVQAVAESKIYQHAKLYMTGSTSSVSEESAVHKASWDKRGHKRFSKMTDSEIDKKITRAVKHLSIEIDATPEQQQKIIALASAVAKDMRPLHGQFHDAGEQLKSLLTAETIDRAAVEKIRAERLTEADRVSKELVTAITDVAEVLTPEQRKVVSERIEQFKSMRGHRRSRWHRG